MNAPSRLSSSSPQSSSPRIRNNRRIKNKNKKKNLLLSLNCILIVTITSSVIWTISSITHRSYNHDGSLLFNYYEHHHLNQQQQHHQHQQHDHLVNNPSPSNTTDCGTTTSKTTGAATYSKTPPVEDGKKEPALPTLLHDFENIPSRVWKKKFQNIVGGDEDNNEFPCYDDGNENKLMRMTPPPKGRGILFHRPHKVGSTTMVGIILRLVHSRRPLSWLHDTNKTDVRCLHRANHGTALEYQYGKRDKRRSFLFSLVRDPTARMISEYFHFRVSVGHNEPTDTDFLRYVRQPKFLNYYLDYFRTRNDYNQYNSVNRTNYNKDDDDDGDDDDDFDDMPLWERFCKDKNLKPEEFHMIINNNTKRKNNNVANAIVTKEEKEYEKMLREGWISYQKKHIIANNNKNNLTQFELWERFCKEMMLLPDEFHWIMNSSNNHNGNSPTAGAAAVAMINDERARILRDEWTEYQKYGPAATTTTKTTSQHYTIVNDILQDYDFIGVTERMDESLVVLQMLLNLTTHDILYTKARTSGGWSNGPTVDRQCIYIAKSFLSPTMQQHFYKSKEWARRVQGDSLLYRAVNASLDRTIDALGRQEFDEKLRVLQEGLVIAERQCSNGRIRAMCTDGGIFIPIPNRTCYIWGEGCDHDCIDEIKKYYL